MDVCNCKKNQKQANLGMGAIKNLVIDRTRLGYVDIAKGVLITYLLIHHIIDFGISNFELGDNYVLTILRELQRPIMLCYFMQAFFFITGYCSNFDNPFTVFLKKQIKSLLIPALIFTVLYYSAKFDFKSLFETLIYFGGRFWFITSLFIAKLFYWLLNKYIKNGVVLFSILLVVSFLSTIINLEGYFPNYWWNRQTMDLCLFLYIGQFMRGKIENRKIQFCSLLIYVITISICYIFEIKIPHVTAGFYTMPSTWFIHILLSLSGTLLLMVICKCINNNKTLEFLGKNSLTIYLFQDVVITLFLKIFASELLNNDILISVFIVLFIWICALIVLSAISLFLNTKYLKWTLGKW